MTLWSTAVRKRSNETAGIRSVIRSAICLHRRWSSALCDRLLPSLSVAISDHKWLPCNLQPVIYKAVDVHTKCLVTKQTHGTRVAGEITGMSFRWRRALFRFDFKLYSIGERVHPGWQSRNLRRVPPKHPAEPKSDLYHHWIPRNEAISSRPT